MKLSKNFDLREFVSLGIHQRWGDKAIWFIDPKLIEIAEFIRERFGWPVTINNWHLDGPYQYSGFRSPSCTIGAKLSQHRFGRAIDIKLMGRSNSGADILREDILNHKDLYMKRGLTTIESGEFAPTWCHIDTRYTKNEGILIVSP